MPMARRRLFLLRSKVSRLGESSQEGDQMCKPGCVGKGIPHRLRPMLPVSQGPLFCRLEASDSLSETSRWFKFGADGAIGKCRER